MSPAIIILVLILFIFVTFISFHHLYCIIVKNSDCPAERVVLLGLLLGADYLLIDKILRLIQNASFGA